MTHTFSLTCPHCPERFADGTTMEAVKMHMQVEHDTDDVRLDLTVVCQCGAAMTLNHTVQSPSGFRDHYDCPACKRSTSVKRGNA